MQQKYYFILVMITIVGAIFISGCFQEEKPKSDMAIASYVDVEATVTSLFLDDLHSHCQKPEVCPRDKVTLRVDKIINRGGSSPSFSILLASEDICLEARDFVNEKPYIDEVGKCKEKKVLKVSKVSADKKPPEVATKTVPGHGQTDSPEIEEPGESVTEGYWFSGKFVAGFVREDEKDLQETLQEQFESELSINPYVAEGDEFEFNLKYSARPAKIRRDLIPSCRAGEVFKSGGCVTEGCEGPECVVSSPQYDGKPTEMGGNYIIYHLAQRTDEITEKVLPGLEENSKIKIRIWYPTLRSLMSKEISEYELI